MANRGGDRTGVARAGGARHYVNHLCVSVSLSLIGFDLAMIGSEARRRLPVWRFTTSPDHFLTMHQGLARALDGYRARYGEIGQVTGDPTAVRIGWSDGDG